MSEPRTAAGRNVLAWWNHDADDDERRDNTEAILAIEAEARADTARPDKPHLRADGYPCTRRDCKQHHADTARPVEPPDSDATLLALREALEWLHDDNAPPHGPDDAPCQIGRILNDSAPAAAEAVAEIEKPWRRAVAELVSTGAPVAKARAGRHELSPAQTASNDELFMRAVQRARALLDTEKDGGE